MMFTEAILVVAAASLTVTGLKVLIYNTAAYARLDASQNPGSLDGEDGFIVISASIQRIYFRLEFIPFVKNK